jgi:hypothetical protein
MDADDLNSFLVNLWKLRLVRDIRPREPSACKAVVELTTQATAFDMDFTG